MEQSSIKHFACDSIEKALLASEWRKWVRSVTLYLDAEEVTDVVKRRNKLLHLGGPQLQEIAFGLPGAITEYDRNTNNDVFKTLIDTLGSHFAPQQNSCFERHVFRKMKPEEGENLNKFVIRLRAQANKCSFGKTETESQQINIKDKLIDMWAPVDLKRKLLEKESTLDEIIEQCQIYEQTQNQTNVMHKLDETEKSETNEFQVNRVDHSRKRKYPEAPMGGNIECFRCGNYHRTEGKKTCPALDKKCLQCGRYGHFARKCKTTPRNAFRPPSVHHQNKPGTSRRVNQIEDDLEDTSGPSTEMKNFECFELENGPRPNDDVRDDMIQILIGGTATTVLIDSGASCNIINGKDWRTLNDNKAIMWDIETQPKSNLKSYASTKPLNIKCKFTAPIRIGNAPESIESFLVVEEGSTSLLGKQTSISLGILKLGLRQEINAVTEVETFPKISNLKVKLTIDPNIKPVQQPVRRVPIAIEAKVEQKLNEALANDIIERVNGHSPWISPMVIVFKPDGDIRICIDMRRANEAILRENFPLPTFDQFMTKMRGAKYFSRLDLTSAYHQLELDEESRPITTFITHKGLFRYKRLMFGINSAPEIFQKIFQSILASCKNCMNYIDDIIVFGGTEAEHDACLQKVLETLKAHNVRLNEQKCLLKVKEIEFLGHILTAAGIRPDPKKIEAVRSFRPPKNIEETRSFLGLVTYIGKFIPDLANLTEPIRKLTRNDTEFRWEKVHQHHFDKLKEALGQLPTLAFFDPKLRTQLIADASPYALGAVLLQFDENAEPRAISFASKSLSAIERRYSQTEKESLALVWGVEKFYFYLCGLHFELVTDHKPLEAIFKPTSKPPARIERWMLRLQAFKYSVIYKSGKTNIADCFSRLCKLENDPTFDEPNEYHVRILVKTTTPKAISISKIVDESRSDTQIIDALTKLLNNSWTQNDNSPFYPFRLELSSMGPLLLRGNRTIIPMSLRNHILELAHEGHPGETVMKRRLRSKVWWPKIDREAENHVKRCRDCLLVSQPNRPATMTRQKLPSGPWIYLALDLMSTGPAGDYLLVLIDYYSRYMEAVFMKSTTSRDIVRVLEEIFARLGLPKRIKIDNGTNLNSAEIVEFADTNGIEITNSPPYWPQANGEVENANKSLKKRLQICYAKNSKDYKREILTYMLMYNVTPHGTTGKSPSELMFNRRIRDKIPSLEDITTDIIDEEVYDRDLIQKEHGKQNEDKRRGAADDQIKPGDRVVIQHPTVSHKLVPRFNTTEYDVMKRNGNELTLSGDGKIVKRNVAHVKKLPPISFTTTNPISNRSTASRDADKESTNWDDVRAGAASKSLSSAQEDTQEEQSTTDERETALPQVPALKLVKRGGMWRPTD